MQKLDKTQVIYPFKLARKEGQIKFKWPVKDFSRLSSLLYQFDDSQEVRDDVVEVTATGHIDEQGLNLLDIEIIAKVYLQCQTSFKPVAYQIDSRVTYCALESEKDFLDIEKMYEPVVADDGQIDLAGIVEDELILSIPVVVNQSADSVSVKMSYGQLDEAAIAEAEKTENPFSVLKDLKKT
ncbi:MAG: YceD family protein [Gammaproteobacteria bacterium]|nr:YceD family protein [Gammaproteobacteria bacterium]MDH5630437.1 YceD family protein [Gammaproteobacteria bacterium]